jgi:hypothetical protein
MTPVARAGKWGGKWGSKWGGRSRPVVCPCCFSY